jgi:hypothetical protein
VHVSLLDFRRSKRGVRHGVGARASALERLDDMVVRSRARWLHVTAFILTLACAARPEAKPSPAEAQGQTNASAQAAGASAQGAGANAQSTGATAQPSASTAAASSPPQTTQPPQPPSPGAETGRTIRFGDASHSDTEPFFPGTTYDANVPSPDTLLRQPLGTFTAHHAEIVAAMRAMEAKSPRMKVVTFGRTHEGRELVYVIVASPEHLKNIEAIRADLGKLADPRSTSTGDADRIVKSSPAVAWLGYSIHGDEMSGADSSLAVAYHFAAGTSADVTDLLKDVVIVIDPMLNPDGRERILSQLEQTAGYVANLDSDSMSRGRWPYGRGNHYLFDMNRDWPFGTQPETRARWAAISSFHPQLLVDAHEMGAMDTFLFYPATEPFTHYFPDATKKWWQTFGNDEAAAFDRHGWSYYTREWADSWYPGYSDSWGSFIGAIGILYEQARFLGQATRRASGEIATYRDAVKRQAAGSLANVTTLAKNREAILRDYLAAKQKNVAAETPGNDRMFVLVPGRNSDREAKFVRMLAGQGIEVMRADAAFTGKHVDTVSRGKKDDQSFPAGSLIIAARQPLSIMVKAYLEFDPRYDKASINRERKELERKQRSRAYDVTAWSPAHAFDLDAYWCDAVDVKSTRVSELPAREHGIVALTKPNEPVYGWVVDGVDDAAVVFAAQAMELGLQVEIGDEAFTLFDGNATQGADGKPSKIEPPKNETAKSADNKSAGDKTASDKSENAKRDGDSSRAASESQLDKLAVSGRTFAVGSLLVRRHENGPDAAAKVARAAEISGAHVFATGTARSHDEGPDLGGQHFKLLARPRIAVLSNAPVDTDSFGHVWHMLDVHIGVPCSLLDAQQLGTYDLRRYNVIVLPEGAIGDLLKENADALRTWVKSGGTLIACGDSAVAIADKELKLTSVKLRDDALDDLEKLALSVKREREAGTKLVDEAELWGDEKKSDARASSEKPSEKSGDKSSEKKSDKSDQKPKSDSDKSKEKAGADTDTSKDKNADAESSEKEARDRSKDDAKSKDKSKSDEDSDKKRRERWLRTFSPHGVILRGEVNLDSWLTAGCREEMPVFYAGSSVFESELPVHTPVRFAAADRLRLSGLLWPEARERIADSGYAMIESQGAGQVILFASSPAFRDWFKGTERLLMNAVVYGPGAGATQPIGW